MEGGGVLFSTNTHFVSFSKWGKKLCIASGEKRQISKE